MIIGLAALCTLALMFYRPDVAQKLRTLSPFRAAPAAEAPAVAVRTALPMDVPASPRVTLTPEAEVGPAPSTAKKIGDERQQQWVTRWLAKRYRVANDATDMLVSAAYATAQDMKLDPLLILAVVGIESGFNPFAESPVGAQGLMQVMAKIHHEKFQRLGGIKAAFNPVANIRVGSMILKEYVSRGGSLEAGLKMYVGAAAFDNDAGYGSRVLAEYRRLKEVSAGKSVPTVVTVPVVARNTVKVRSTQESSPAVESATSDKQIAPEAARTATPEDLTAAL